jgi:phage tail-like protein
MDANGLKFWLLAEAKDWFRPGNPPAVQYSANRRALRLARQQLPRWSLVVVNGDGRESNPLYFGVATDETFPLRVTQLFPSVPQVSPEEQTVLVSGEGFTPDMTVTVTLANGQTTVLTGVQPDPEDPSELSLSLALSVVGPATLSVSLPNGEQSPPYFFTVLPASLPDLALTRLNPALPSRNQDLEVAGRGFQPDSRLRVTLPGGRRVELETAALEAQTATSLRFNLALATVESETEAETALQQVPPSRDDQGTTARWDTIQGKVLATGAAPGDVEIYTPANDGAEVTDLAIGHDGVLYLAVDGQVVMQDLRRRWSPVTLEAPAPAWRLAPAPDAVWVLDAPRSGTAERHLLRLTGRPLPDRPGTGYSPNTFRPNPENPHPPRLETVWSGSFAEEWVVAIAASPRGRLALLTWVNDADARLRLWLPDGAWSAPLTLTNARFPYSLTWATEDRIALMLTGVPNEAPVYEILSAPADQPQTVYPLGEFYPLRNGTGEPFYHGLSLPAHYPTEGKPHPLLPLALPTFAPSGEARGSRPFDSGSSQTVWHRLYLEAAILPACAVRVLLGTSEDDGEMPGEWFEHRFGGTPSADSRDIPQGTWLSMSSEIPYQPGLLACPLEPQQAGLFTVLIQRSGRQVRALKGRYLWVRLELSGDGQSSPEIAALRAYGSRFSYRDRYLPDLYSETRFGDAADAPGPSTPADFLERFLTTFESILTPLEDRIARADLLTDPRTVPEEALEWLGSWVGLSFDGGYPTAQRRRLLREAANLYPKRGTLAGLKQALDIATDDGVTSGEIVVLEDFRLRRTFATILGADLADETDPLLQGIAVSGNSYVGDTLFLGDETRREFLALFGPDLPNDAEEEAILAFFDELAFRVTVLVHQDVEPQDLGLIRRIVEQETPAHLLTRVFTATYPFLVSISSLIGVDTYLAPKPDPNPVRLGTSHLGVRDLVLSPPTLDPRLGGGVP